MSRHRHFRGKNVEHEFGDGVGDAWGAEDDLYLGASPASPTSSMYIRRAAGTSHLGEGSRVRALYEGDGIWYPGKIIRVFGGGEYGVQFDGYYDWERCSQVEAVSSPRQGPTHSDHNDSPYARVAAERSAPEAPSALAPQKEWDKGLIDREMPAIRAVVGTGVEEEKVIEVLRSVNYNADRAILKLTSQGGSSFVVPINIGEQANTSSHSQQKDAAVAKGSGIAQILGRGRSLSGSCDLSDLDALVTKEQDDDGKNGGAAASDTKAASSVCNPPPKVKRNSGSLFSQMQARENTEKGKASDKGMAKEEKNTNRKGKRSGNSSGQNSKQTSRRSARVLSAADNKRREKLLGSLKKSADSGDNRKMLNMVVIGHVDAGKSTLMGHLLYRLGEIDKRTMHKFEKESKECGKSSFKYAWALDEQGEERERGVTIDVATKTFMLPDLQVVLLDAPGHRDFIPNMISGASQADVALLVVTAGQSEFETGFLRGGQTKEHIILAKSMGIKQILIAINKMDTIDWDQDQYNCIIATLTPFLARSGFKDEKDVRFVPVSGLSGENLVAQSPQGPLAEWSDYSGTTLAAAINGFRPSKRERAAAKPLRLSVADVYKSMRLGPMAVSGRIQSGTVVVGDEVLVMPINELCTVKSMNDHRGLPCKAAVAGSNVEIGLQGLDDASMLHVGCLLCDPVNPIKMVVSFEAQVQTLETLKIPLVKGIQFTMHVHNTDVPCTVRKLIGLCDKTDPSTILQKKPRRIGRNEVAKIRIEMVEGHPGICLETFQDFKGLGRVLLRDNGVTVCVGVVTKLKSRRKRGRRE